MFRPLRPKHWKTMKKAIKKQFAFTLIELLVVIAIIGILSALIIVGMSSTTQKASVAKSQVFANSLRNSLMSNLVSEWKLDGNANDSWSGGNNGTWNGSGGGSNTTANYRPAAECVSGQCLNFDGTDDYVNCGTIAFLNSNFSIAFWVKGTSGVPISKSVIGDVANYALFYPNPGTAKILWEVRGTVGSDNLLSSSDVFNNMWHSVILNKNSTSGMIYVDGKSDGTATLDVSYTDSGSFLIGRYGHNTNLFLNGLMDEVRIFNAAMPTSQIQQNYFAGLNKLFAKTQITKSDYQQRLVALSTNYVKR